MTDFLNPPGAPPIGEEAYSYDWKQGLPMPPSALPPKVKKESASAAPSQSGGMEIPEPAPINSSREQVTSGEAEKGITPTRLQQVGAVLGLSSDKSPLGIPGFMDTSPGALLRAHEENLADERAQQEGLAKISPDEANRRFPGMPVPFNEPVNPYIAELQYNSQKHREQMQEWLSRGKALPWGAETAIGIAGGVFDPVNLMAMYLTGGASKALGLTRNVLTTFGENLAINAATGAISYKQEQAEHQAVSIPEATGQAVGGAVGGTLLHYAASGLFKVLGNSVDAIRKTPPDIREQNMRTAIAQSESGARVDTSAGNLESASRARGDIEGQSSPYRFTPVDHPSERPYYAAKDVQGNPASYRELGPGLHAVDDGVVANNQVAAGENGGAGKVAEMRISPDAQILNLDQPATAVDEKFIKALEEKTGVKLDVQPDESIKDVLSRLGGMAESGDAPHDILSQVQDIAKSEGYSGYQFTEGDADTGSKKNHVLLFDENHQPSNVYAANPEIVPQRSADEIKSEGQRMGEASASNNYTPDREKMTHDFQHEKSLNSKPDYMDPFIKEQYDSARTQLDAMAKDNPALAKEIKDILDKSDVVDKQEMQAVKELANCLGAG